MSEHSKAFEIVKNIIVDSFNVQPSSVTNDLTYEELGADSLDVVELIMEFEEVFNIQFTDEQIRKVKTVGETVQYIDLLLE